MMAQDILDIVGGTILDGTGAKPRPNTALRAEDGRIVAIWSGEGRPPNARAPAGRTIDATGKTVMPGLIDAHCHISYGEGRTAEELDIYSGAEWSTARAIWNARKVLNAGVTSFCDPGSSWLVAVTVRDAVANGMFPGPRVFAGGRHIGADGAFVDYFPSWLGMPVSAEGVLCPTRDEMLREVRLQTKNRVDLIKLSGDSQVQEKCPDAGPCFTDEEIEDVVDLSHRLGRKVTIHARYPETIVAAVRAKVDWIIHATYLRRQDIGYVRDAGIALCPTLTFAANIVEWGKDAGVEAGHIEARKREIGGLVETHQLTHEAGIPLLAGSESGFSMTPYGEWHARELELLVKLLGLSPMEAILAATRNNARAFGWENEVGTLQPGRRADILIVDGDPLADIRILQDPSKILSVLQGGVEIDRSGGIPQRARMGHERGFAVSTKRLRRDAASGQVIYADR
jgi:imidazolonepropionase-like amidohydrolase